MLCGPTKLLAPLHSAPQEYLFNAIWITVRKIISYKFTTGVVITGNAEKLVQHVRDYCQNKSTEVTEVL